jgi:cytochrome P450
MFGDPITNVPHVPRRIALLDAGYMVRNPVEVLETYRQQLGPTFSFHFGGARRAVVSTDPEFLHHVLKTNQENYEKADIQTARMVEFQGAGLVNIHGQDWLRQRKLIARGFTPKRLADLLPLQQAVLTEWLPHFETGDPGRCGPRRLESTDDSSHPVSDRRRNLRSQYDRGPVKANS